MLFFFSYMLLLKAFVFLGLNKKAIFFRYVELVIIFEIWVFKIKLGNMPEDVPFLQTIIHFTWTSRRSGEKSKLRGNWWNFDLRWAVWAQVDEWIRRVPVSYRVYFYRVCVCRHTCVLISVILVSPNHQFAWLWLSLCAACFLSSFCFALLIQTKRI